LRNTTSGIYLNFAFAFFECQKPNQTALNFKILLNNARLASQERPRRSDDSASANTQKSTRITNPGPAMKYDLVLMFPYKSGLEKSQRKNNFNKATFINSMLGIRVVKRSDGVTEEFIDEAQRILRSSRCFLLPDGTPNEAISKIEKTLLQTENRNDILELNHQLMEETKRCLHNEYVEFTGSDEPTTQQKFVELMLRTVVKRVRTACGLTTKMKMNKKGDE
jgi:hypothetical protein